VNEAFAGVPELVPVFPLPEVVLFPRQILPLHVFEPRYRAMVADALEGERTIAIALLKPEYEPDYFTPHAPIHTLVGVGRIIASERLEEGKYNILLRGRTRAKIVDEIAGRPYRVARIEPVQPH
jgi:Lon protease-like protein